MAITPQEALQHCSEHHELFHDEMSAMMRLIMSGEMSPELVAGLLVALRTKKETVGEIAAAAQVMREFATSVDVKDRTHLVDVVGTGGWCPYVQYLNRCYVCGGGCRGKNCKTRQSQR